MDGLRIFLLILQGVGSLSHDWISRPVLEVSVRPGDNITLYCDCKTSTGVFIVWYRNCSHENQPPLVLELNLGELKHISEAAVVQNPLPRFHFVRNQSSESYDLLIMNITDSDEGLYYCGTGENKVLVKETITLEKVYSYGNITTRVLFNSSEPHGPITQDCGVCWMLLFSLCPAFAVLSSLLSVLVNHLCQKAVLSQLNIYQVLLFTMLVVMVFDALIMSAAGEPKTDGKRPDSWNKDGGVCFAAMEILQTSQRPKKKRTLNSDSSTYSAIYYTVQGGCEEM